MPRKWNVTSSGRARTVPPEDIQDIERSFGGRLSVGEMSTISAMQQYCRRVVMEGQQLELEGHDEHDQDPLTTTIAKKKNKSKNKNKWLVFYAHAKGGCCGRSTHQPPYWREMMSAYNLEYPSLCMNTLLGRHKDQLEDNKVKYKVCGVNLRTTFPPGTSIPPHYSGNFWWSTCEHIASLPLLTNDGK